ncbi:MAG: HlyD family efflux transporter periplasmic adaptor subunit, partial [Planctomycetota bacterium]|nr:HlyD family efflux transporter periplasmic adaptor subunit [Planctomycetota bacterium]
EADVIAQKSLVALKLVQVEEAKVDFQKAVITAPSKGVIISDNVQKDDFVQPGTSLLVFEDTSAVEVRCDLRSDQLQAILETKDLRSQEGSRFSLPPLEAEICYESNDKLYHWSGRLDRYDGLGLDERTRTAPCRIRVDHTLSNNGQRTLVRGMYVSIELNLGKKQGLLALPSEAVHAGNVVWILESGKLRKQKVNILNRVRRASEGEMVIVKAKSGDLDSGDRIIVSPIPQPVDGMDLRASGSDSGDLSQLDFSDQRETVNRPSKLLGPAGATWCVYQGLV